MGSITLHWVKEHLFTLTDSNGHSIVVGHNPDQPDHWAGIKPSDLLLMATASCSSWDVVEILQKQREPLRDLTVACHGEQKSEPPFSFTCIHLHYVAFGEVNPEKLAKAIRLSEDKYCSVINTLKPGVVISSDFEIRN